MSQETANSDLYANPSRFFNGTFSELPESVVNRAECRRISEYPSKSQIINQSSVTSLDSLTHSPTLTTHCHPTSDIRHPKRGSLAGFDGTIPHDNACQHKTTDRRFVIVPLENTNDRMTLPLLSLLLFLPHVVSLAFQTIDIPRVSLSEFQDLYHENGRRQTPILVEHALTENSCEAICDTIVSTDSLQVDLQRKRPDVPSATYNVEIRQAIEAIMYSSHHKDALFCFEEGLLDDVSPKVSEQLRNCRETVFPDEDWFPYFPDWARSTDCLILAGEGATSTLHRDPYEWTGTSLCLEGSKVWRFIEPPEDFPTPIDTLLDSYRLPSTAWDHETALSAGWQSDKSLYQSRSESIPSAREFQAVPDKLQRMRAAAMSTQQLTPTPALLNNQLAEGETTTTATTTLWTTVQTTGDLLVIPAYWWHQTYGLEPSVAIASQRCSAREAKQVLQHILNTTGSQDSVDLNDIIDYSNPKSTIKKFFAVLKGELEKV
jgi:hypothetical protein